MRHSKKIAAQISATSWAKVVLFVGLSAALVAYVGLDRMLAEGTLFLSMPWYLIIVVLVLMPLNMGLEWKKYQLAIHPLGASIATLNKAFARGLTWRFILPNKMGLAASVVLSSPSATQLDTAWRLAMANSMQLAVTLVLGFVSFFSLQDRVSHTLQIQNYWLWILGFCSVAVVGVLFRKRIAKQWSTLRSTPLTLLRQFFALSVLRYGVFLLQFALAVTVLNPDISWLLSFQTVPLVFLYASLIPLGFLGSIGARESIAVAVFTLVVGDAQGIVAASVLVWAVNLLLPAVLGLVSHAVIVTRSKAQC